MSTILLSFGLILLGGTGMAIGVILRKSKGELRGSCGGSDFNPDCCKAKQKDCHKSCQ